VKIEGRTERVAILRRVDYWRAQPPEEIRQALLSQVKLMVGDDPFA
jgi:hypothetical protein